MLKSDDRFAPAYGSALGTEVHSFFLSRNITGGLMHDHCTLIYSILCTILVPFPSCDRSLIALNFDDGVLRLLPDVSHHLRALYSLRCLPKTILQPTEFVRFLRLLTQAFTTITNGACMISLLPAYSQRLFLLPSGYP